LYCMQRKPRRYRVRFELVDPLMESLGYETDQAKAAFLGIQQSTLLRVRRGDVEPSTKFLGAVQDRFPARSFDDLIERVDCDEDSHPSGPAGPRPSGPAGPRPKTGDAA
jgi:hypothetical protein